MFPSYKYFFIVSCKLHRLALWQGYRLYLQQFCTLSLESIRDVEHFRQSFFSDGFDSKRARLTVRVPPLFSSIFGFSIISFWFSMTFELCICSSVLFRENASASSIWRKRGMHCQTRVRFKTCWASWDLCAFSCRLFCLMKVYAGSCTMVPSVRLLGVVYHTDNKRWLTSFLYFLRLVIHVQHMQIPDVSRPRFTGSQKHAFICEVKIFTRLQKATIIFQINSVLFLRDHKI